jgi:hypothetical protein
MVAAMSRRSWALLSTHGLVLLAIARRPDARLRDIAHAVGITPRAAQATVNDLVAAGYVERHRDGRRNRYLVHGERALPHPTTRDHDVAELLGGLTRPPRVRPVSGEPVAAVLACTDYRYQEPLRELLAAEGLLTRAEVFLWPGGSAALGGPQAPAILHAIRWALEERPPQRVFLVSHQDCDAPGARVRAARDPLRTGRAVLRRQGRGADRARRVLGTEPELWFLSERGASRLISGRRRRATVAG